MFVFMLLITISSCTTQKNFVGSANDRSSLTKTSEEIHKGFLDGDVDKIMLFHHPQVIKAFAYDKYVVGAEAVRTGLVETLKSYRLEFVENKVENTFFQGKTAVESYLFVIKGTPKNGGDPFLFKGRSVVTYVRYKNSPTGWASIREVIQPSQ